MAALVGGGVTVHGDDSIRPLDARIVAATAAEYDAEYPLLDLAAKVVDGLDEAIAHIRVHTSGHSRRSSPTTLPPRTASRLRSMRQPYW